MMNVNTLIESKKNIIVWGFGEHLRTVIDKINPKLPIKYFCDSNKEKVGMQIEYGNRMYSCVSSSIVKKEKDVLVLVAVRLKSDYLAIEHELNQSNIVCVHINELVKDYQQHWEKNEIEKYDKSMKNVAEPEELDKLKCFVSISVPIQKCNLRCEYCYIGQNGGFEDRNAIYPSAQFIRRALSRKRLGGTALLNFCGVGETLLCSELIDIVLALLEEGHYVSIITNALLTSRIQSLLSVNPEYNRRIFFKCSFHYKQLLEKNLLSKFAENVQMIKEMGASFSVELVPEDSIISYIDEIKKFCVTHFGALPHVTVARDESKADMPILTSLNESKYKEVWGQFQSEMFEIKMQSRVKRTEFCLAGKGTFILDLETGKMYQCPHNEMFGNLYLHIDQAIPCKVVGKNCKSEYCINAHAYLSLGMIDEINQYSYLSIRDRETEDKNHWVQPEMADFISQRICENV